MHLQAFIHCMQKYSHNPALAGFESNRKVCPKENRNCHLASGFLCQSCHGRAEDGPDSVKGSAKYPGQAALLIS